MLEKLIHALMNDIEVEIRSVLSEFPEDYDYANLIRPLALWAIPKLYGDEETEYIRLYANLSNLRDFYGHQHHLSENYKRTLERNDSQIVDDLIKLGRKQINRQEISNLFDQLLEQAWGGVGKEMPDVDQRRKDRVRLASAILQGRFT
jgi:hypothetical protein